MSDKFVKMLLFCYYYIVISAVIYFTQQNILIAEILTYAVIAMVLAMVIYFLGDGATLSYFLVVLINAFSQGLVISATITLLDITVSISTLAIISSIGIVLMALLLLTSNYINNQNVKFNLILFLNIAIILGVIIGYLSTKDLVYLISFMMLVIVNFNSTIFTSGYNRRNNYMKYLAKRSFGVYIVIVPILIIVAYFSGDGDGDIGDIFPGGDSKTKRSYSDGYLDGMIVQDFVNTVENRNKEKKRKTDM